MASPTEKEENIPADFIHCVEKLLSSISTLSKHLSILTIQKETTKLNEQELTNKLQAIKDAINSLAPAVQTAKQLVSKSSLVERLINEYSCLCNDYKKHYSLKMVDTSSFVEYNQYIERLSSWLSSTNANIHEVLQSVNKQRALLIIKNLDELSKYKSLLERATTLNRTMAADLPDEQATKMTNEIANVKEQWRILTEGLNTLKERHASRYASPERNKEEDRLTKQNENLVHYIESWLTLARELIYQQKQLTMNNHNMIDDRKYFLDSMISSDNEINEHSLLYQLKECEQEVNRLKTLLDENRRTLKGDDMTTSEVTRSLTDELTEIAKSVTTARIQLENRIEQQRGFLLELDSLINWLKNFINESKTIDNQTIELALNERQQHFNELIKCCYINNHEVKDKIEHLIQMWNQLTSMITEPPTVVAAQSSTPPQLSLPLLVSSSLSEKEQQFKLVEEAKELLNTAVQLGNHQEIEQLQNKIQSLITNIDIVIFHDQSKIVSDWKLDPLDSVRDELANRQSILKQMLIDTIRIDQLRVNFVSHFSTENNTTTANNEIIDIIDNYPKEMTTEIRQWLNEQQKIRITAPIATMDVSKSIDDFDEYLKQIEGNINSYKENENNESKLKKILQLIEERPNLPQNLNNYDKERVENLHQRLLYAQKQIEDIRYKNSSTINTDQIINNIDLLIKRVRDIEEQIRINVIQPISDYGRLILDCQRIITELDQNLRPHVEQMLNTGKRLYTSDNKDSSGIESADDTRGGKFELSSSPSPPLKKYSDLTLRKVRRHVIQLTQRWKNANTNVRQRLKILQRAQTAVEELRRKCDQLHAHLLEIELAHAHQPQIRAINSEQVPAEIEHTKNLLSSLMSCKTSIDEIQQLAQTIENEYDIHTTNRVQELSQRWEHSIQSISQRVQLLQDSVKISENDMYSKSVEYPWQRAIAFNKVPYFINHSDQSTSWDHPKMIELMRSFSNFNDIRFSAYRTAMKLRTLQKRLCLFVLVDLTSLSDIISVFEEHQTIDLPNKNIDKYVDITEILYYLQSIFEKTSNEYPQLINIIVTVDLTLNWLLNIYDTNRTGSIRLLAMKMALALLCRGNIEEKYRYIFSLVACPSTDNDVRDVVDRQRLSILFQQAIVIPKQLGEIAAFGGSSVEPSVKSCFDYAHNPNVLTANDFLEWIKLEPQSLVWLPVMHRLAASEAAKHEARCSICKIYPILGFRYRSLKHFNCDICQSCFFSGKQTKFFKMDDPLQEYYTETTSSEDIRDFFRIFKNKLWTKHRKQPKLGYLPLPHVFDNNMSTTSQPTSSPVLIPVLTTPFKSDIGSVQPTGSTIESTDEHGIIAQHCRNLNSFVHASPRVAAHDILTRSRSLDNEQRNELEAIIRDLEDENRLLQNEYERLCQQHMEKSLIINDRQYQFHQSDSQLGSLSLINDYNTSDREMLREAKQLRHHKTKLEQRMKILEEHNKQLEKQLRKSKQLLFRESPSLHHHTSNGNMTEHRSTTISSPLHSSTLGLRRSMERNLERQSNLITIDNLFHMADDINRAVGDLVSVITEPQTNNSPSYYQQIDNTVAS
ncbi:unnamed protein product [Rotaria sordida]|uniref:Dystrophin n=1 Tax=Rotaria sordida TaxID=392033 RepID=A0A818JHY5_9BILA|nr:unnamed protein product [Rotaria sordida]